LEELHLHILEAAGGKEGVRLFKDNPDISVVLLDIRLPGVSGFDILKELKKERPQVPVIAETAFAMSGDRENCLDAGFDEYISKPVSRKALIEIVQQFISTD
jgi:CheY-like chemotaxis protein